MWHILKHEGVWSFIKGSTLKCCSRKIFRNLKRILIGLAIIIAIVAIKYKPAYVVTLAGETIGYVSNKNEVENEIDEYVNDTDGNIAFRVAENLPEYNFTLVSRKVETDEEEVLLTVENQISTTYETYAITVDGETLADVSSEEEAEEIVEEVKSDLSEEIEMTLGITTVYSDTLDVESKEEALAALTEVKTAKVTDYETAKAEEEAAAAAAEEAAKKAASTSSYNKAVSSTTTVAASGALDGMQLSIPVSGSISSRFGSRSSSRSTAHTGLDISASTGTGIRAIAGGTVTYAGYKGSYGNLIIVDHGNGVESYYAHCSALYVSVGTYVDSSTTIAAVGSTGNSTGPHLHLEIRIDGTPVDPQNYLYN